MQLLPAFLALFSILLPTKLWFTLNEPLNIKVKADSAITLILTGFDGKPIDPKGSNEIAAGADPTTADIAAIYPNVKTGGTYVLWAVPKGKQIADFVGTPIVIETRVDKPAAGGRPTVIHLEPLRYAVATTNQGPMTMIFFYDVAPNTAESFLRLSSEGFYDGLTFHRIVPGFVIQGGDPRGDGTGGPGYSVEAEFNKRPHEEGALSMARSADPNSAGSQFFVCLDYHQTQQLDGQYTVFGKVVDGMDAVKKIAATPISDPQTGKPSAQQIIKKIEVFPVTPGKNPYAQLFNMPAAK